MSQFFLSDNFGESKRSIQTSPQYNAHAKCIHNQLVTGMVKTSDKIITHHPITESVVYEGKSFYNIPCLSIYLVTLGIL